MNIFELLQIDAAVEDIDLQMTPIDTYGLFECRGDMHRVRSRNERYYYFYINNWEKPASLCFMERGIRHAKILAQIYAPQKMIDECVTSQGKTYKENSFAIDEQIRSWLKKHIITQADTKKIIPLNCKNKEFQPEELLPEKKREDCLQQEVFLRQEPRIIAEADVPEIFKQHDFFETTYNPGGIFQNCLIRTRDTDTVLDMKTGLMWQLAGSDISSFCQLQRWVTAINQKELSGYNDWRLPTIEEALSLVGSEKGKHGSYIHQCFDSKQGYIYTADRRKPGGYWFVDFRQARLFWASGTFAGGFGRLCRSERTPPPDKN